MPRTSKKSCENCLFCEQLFRVFCCSFGKTRAHYCTAREQITHRRNDACALWQRKKNTYDLSPERLDEVEQDILFLSDKYKDL